MPRVQPERVHVDPRPPSRGSIASCATCGKEVRQYPSQPRKYCSRACRDVGLATGPSVELTCGTCGGRYRVIPSKAARSKFCSRSCAAQTKRPGRPPSPIGSTSITAYGYVAVRVESGHWAAQANTNRALQHRLVMAEMIGRPLRPEENVHHINGVKTDNRPANLELWVRSQPCGQRVVDVLAWAREIVERYG